MELNSNHASPVLADPVPVNKSRLGIPSPLFPCSQLGTSFSSGTYATLVPRKKPVKLDDVRSNGWLDAMKASSPPRKKLIKGPIAGNFFDVDAENGYISWLLKYPSALTSFEQIMHTARNKKIAVFLDYDGTLSPIVDDPDRAILSDAMRATVRSLAENFPTAIISGRSRNKVYDLVGLTELYYAGSHGMDIVGPMNRTMPVDHPNCVKFTNQQGEEANLFQPAREFLPLIDEVFRTLIENTKEINGTKVENHKFCVSVHYRNVDEKNWPTVAQRVHDILKGYPRLHLTHGRKVLEVRPEVDWNKGKAVQFLLESLGLHNSDDVLPIYIGDDRTDEDAFKVLREGNRKGYGILVTSVPKETKAFYSLRDTVEVMKFLENLVSWKKREDTGEAFSFT